MRTGLQSSAFRGPLVYAGPAGDRLDGVPLDGLAALSQISGIQVLADDFLIYAGPNTAGEAGGYLLTEVAVGAGNVNRVDVDDNQPFGVLLLKTDNAASDDETLQVRGEPWKYVVGKQLWFNIRLKGDSVGAMALFCGLAVSDTTPIGSLPTDGLFFEKAAAATKMDFHGRKGGTSTERTSVDPAALANDTYVEYGFWVDPVGNVHVYVNGTEVSAAAIAAGNANLPNTLALALILAVQTNGAASRELRVDHVLVAQER